MDLQEKIQSKRHEELLRALGKVSSAIKTDDDNKVVVAIDKMGAKLDVFISAINELVQYEKTENKEDKNEDKTISLVADLAKSIVSGLGDMKNEIKDLNKPQPKTEWVHTITKRNYGGWAEEIVSKPKNKV